MKIGRRIAVSDIFSAEDVVAEKSSKICDGKGVLKTLMAAVGGYAESNARFAELVKCSKEDRPCVQFFAVQLPKNVVLFLHATIDIRHPKFMR